MALSSLIIATRTSPLALWQAEFVRNALMRHYPELNIQLKGIKTTADKWATLPLDKIGGKGVFVKELEEALLSGEADIAVHSLKDVPAFFPKGLGIGAILKREDPRDAWICPRGWSLDAIPSGSVIGTSSLRRRVQLQKIRPDLDYAPLRGNVETRLSKCKAGEWDAIVLAVAGLSRLNLLSDITRIFEEESLLPAVGQGALGVECRIEDETILNYLKVLDHMPTRLCVEAGRAMNAALGGSCQVPVAGLAEISNDKIVLRGRVGHPLKTALLEAKAEDKKQNAQALGEAVAKDLIAQGADKLIQDILKS